MDLGYRCSLLYKAFWGEENIGLQVRISNMESEVEFKRADELLIERFEEWLARNNYSEKTVKDRVRHLKRIFREIGFPTVEKFDEKYGWRPNTSKKHLSNAFNLFQEFLRSSLTEEEKKKEVVVGNEVG